MRGIFRLHADVTGVWPGIDTLRPQATPQQQSVRAGQVRPGYSRPFFDTGEHVLAGESPEIDGLLSGVQLTVQGIPVTYGELIAAADLFDTADQMEQVPKKQVQKLLELIRKSKAFYQKRESMRFWWDDVSHEEWEKETDKRYLRLAEDNFEHFAYDPAYPTRNNKTEWHKHHQVALAQKARGNLNKALIYNAFGDHFLTDAFSSGHLVSKSKVFDDVKRVVYTNPKKYTHTVERTGPNGSLTVNNLSQIGVDLVLAVAKDAYKDGDLAAYFKKFEIRRGGVNPDIDNESVFVALMLGIADDLKDGQPHILNFVLKAIHDYLNTTGVEVQVQGSVIQLFGDGKLNSQMMPFINKAVESSISEIVVGVQQGPSRTGEGPISSWDLTPIPTASGRRRIDGISNINVSNRDLVNYMSGVVKGEYKLIAAKLLEKDRIGEPWWEGWIPFV